MPARNGAEANHMYPKANIQVLTQLIQQNGYEIAAFGKVAHDKMNYTSKFDAYNKESTNSLANNVKSYLSTNHSTKPLCLFVGASSVLYRYQRHTQA
jgi:hypothetical protein